MNPFITVVNRPSLCFLMLFFALFGCIEKYLPDEEELQTGTLVVVGDLNNLPGVQSVYLSRSTSLKKIAQDPVRECFVQVERSDGTVADFEESEPGKYSCYMDETFLEPGSEYRLVFLTNEGEHYESEFERIHPPSDIHAVYYEREDRSTSDPAVVEQGIKFFIDFEIEKDSGRFLRWQLNETYEIQNPDYETRMYGVDRRWYDIRGNEKWLKCWISQNIPEIYTLDLWNVEGSVYQRLPLNFVSDQTQRLLYRYSLLVRQYSMTEKAFWYWNELGKNAQSKGGLFDTQPALTPSNICNINNEDELVIGYFSISGASELRIFVDNVPDLKVFNEPYYCAPGVFPMYLWRYPTEKLPLYVARATINGILENGEVRDDCVDCRLKKNSTHIKPAFW